MFQRKSQSGDPKYCAICLGPFQDPRIVGDCRHSFCLQCISGYIGGLQGGGAFSCPLCRQQCILPEGGASALAQDREEASKTQEGKSTSRTLCDPREVQNRQASVRATVPVPEVMANRPAQPAKATKGIEPPCSVCYKVGSPETKFCKSCHEIYMCVTCADTHSSQPMTGHHRLFSVCGFHGKPAEFFCQNCGCSACSVCLIASHSGDAHAVQSMADKFTSVLSELRDLEPDVQRTLAAMDETKGVMTNADAKMRKQYTSTLAKKESGLKAKDQEQSTKLQQVQQEIGKTRQKLDGLLKQEAQLKEQRKKTKQDGQTDIEGFTNTMKYKLMGVKSSVSELDELRGKLSDGFDTSKGLLNINTLSTDNIGLIQATAAGIRGMVMLAAVKTSEAEKMKKDLAPYLKHEELYFSQHHSPGITLSGDKKTASWSDMPMQGSRYRQSGFGFVIMKQDLIPNEPLRIVAEAVQDTGYQRGYGGWQYGGYQQDYGDCSSLPSSLYFGLTQATPESIGLQMQSNGHNAICIEYHNRSEDDYDYDDTGATVDEYFEQLDIGGRTRSDYFPYGFTGNYPCIADLSVLGWNDYHSHGSVTVGRQDDGTTVIVYENTGAKVIYPNQGHGDLYLCLAFDRRYVKQVQIQECN